ncbi:hypothetical protein ACW7G2_10780 [Luteimonas sp. A277]
MKALGKLFDGLTVVLMLLNMLGGIVAGIWLAILGEWGTIFRGLAALILGGFVISLAMMPSLLLAAPAAALQSKGSRAGFYFFGLLSMVYTYAVLIAWCILVMLYFANRADGDSVIPTMLWAYGAATGPIAYLAQKDLQSGNEYAAISTFFAQVAFVVSVFVAFILRPGLLGVVLVFSTIMLVGLVLQAVIAHSVDKAQRSYGRI